MRESLIESYLTSRAQALGWLSYKFVSGVRGVPDRILIAPCGLVLFVEVKQRNGRLSSAQEYQIARLQGNNALVFVVWSREDVDALFARFSG